MSRHYALCRALAFTFFTGRRPRMARATAAEWRTCVAYDAERWLVSSTALAWAYRDRMFKAAWELLQMGFEPAPSQSSASRIVFRWMRPSQEVLFQRINDYIKCWHGHAQATAHADGRAEVWDDRQGRHRVVARYRNGGRGGRPVGLPVRMDDVARQDTSNCAVCAISWLTDTPYGQVREICERHGYNQNGRRGMMPTGIEAALAELGWAMSRMVIPHEIGAGSTLASVQRRLRQGRDPNRWLVFTKGHVLACHPGGRFEDTARCGSRTRVWTMCRVEKMS